MALSSFGFYLNDEADQAAAFYNLAHGSLRVEDVPSSAYALHDNVSWQRRWGDVPVASTPLNILALPMAAFILVLDWFAPLPIWLAASFLTCIWFGLPAGWRTSLASNPLARALLLFAAVIIAAGRFRVGGPTTAFYWPIIAIQLTNILLAAGGAWLLWTVLGKYAPSWPSRLVPWLATVMGPWLYWGFALKYHMLAAVTVIGILAVWQRPPSPRRDLGVAFLAGFATWVNIGVGLVAVLALAAVESMRLVLGPGRRAVLRDRWTWLALGGLMGLLPFFLENFMLFGNPLHSPYFALHDGGSTGQVSSSPDVGNVLTGILYWNGWQDFGLNLASLLTTGHRVEGKPFGIFLISPVLAAALVGVVRAMRRRPRDPVVWFAVVFLAMQALLFTNAGVRQGAGGDARLWFHVLPLLGLLAAFGLQPVLLRFQRAEATAVMAPMATLAVAGVFLLVVLGQFNWMLNPDEDGHVTDAYFLVAAMAAAAAGISLVFPGRPPWSRRIALACGFLLAVPAFWGALLPLYSKHLPDYAGAEGGHMLVPGMNPIADWYQRRAFPPQPAPFVYDADGNLVYHPDYGRCIGDPNPCPTEVRASLKKPPALNWTSGT